MVSKQEDTMASVTIGECTIEVFISIYLLPRMLIYILNCRQSSQSPLQYSDLSHTTSRSEVPKMHLSPAGTLLRTGNTTIPLTGSATTSGAQ